MNQQLHDLFLHNTSIPIGQLAAYNVPIIATTYLTLGGGLGSFAWVDHLRVYGVPASDIMAVGITPEPHGRYRRLCRNSQIPDEERLRSDSGSTPDNLWGWPGYAVREIGQSLKEGHVMQASKLSWQIFSETALSSAYTPKAGDVYRAIERESERIGWSQIWRYGRIRCIRKSDDGRYAALCETEATASGNVSDFVVIGEYLHIALGYPGVRFLPELQHYRQQTKDFERVVNAYEPHEQLYTQLVAQGGTVLLRGRGIVASRILQRLHEVQQANPAVTIHVIHLMRSPREINTRYNRAQRFTEHHWQLQPFNFPKACFTGDLRARFAKLSPQDRAEMIQLWAGTTTADRLDWREIVSTGLQAGWYQIRFGKLASLEPLPDGRLCAQLAVRSAWHEVSKLALDYVIDCTGLASNFQANPLLCDLRSHYDLTPNPLGNLDVTPNFEVDALRNGSGRVFAAGAMTLGGPFGPVDSFLGLQYAAHRSVAALQQMGAPALRVMTPMRSAQQWLYWARKEAP